MSGTQLSWDDAEDDETILAPADRLSNWRAFVAPLAAHREVVVKDTEAVRLARDVVAVFAEHSALSGLTRAQLLDLLGPAGRGWPVPVVESRLGLLIDMGFLEPYLLKAHQDRYVVRPAGLAGAFAAERLSLYGGVDELVGLLDRTRELFELVDPDPVKALEALQDCRHGLLVFALDLQRQVVNATLDELIRTQRRHDRTDFPEQVVALNGLVTRAFSGHLVLEDAATALIEAAQFYRQALLAAVGKILENGGGSLNLDVLTPAEYHQLTRTAGVEQLGHFGDRLVADAPPPWVDGQAIVDTAAEYAPSSPPKSRPTPPEARGDSRSDPFAALEEAEAHEAIRRQVLVEDLLAGLTETDVTAVLEDQGWPAAARTLVDLLACDEDPEVPVRVELAVPVRVDSTATITYLHQVTLHLSPGSGDGG
ncbi:hypothetical protein [Streptomyces sp. BE133]|uniref:hypothetical protein n=1 Tax=Streptomyces sp. BE133 TaxID=3002523 RepID=UPI002E76BB82|nr:hypothetical protein [Streptomyces sp. BE133]MEE1811659.1 hypothetical protein [Streptomyces sp. BE133]